MRRVLTEVLGVRDENVTALVGTETKTRPSSSNIRRELSRLAREAGQGDRVVLYFAGHGSQQRDQTGDEPDGLDEVFLPSDVGPTTDKKGAIPRALSDDQLGRAARRIRDAGATVWMIFDCCHAGTMARGGSGSGGGTPNDTTPPADVGSLSAASASGQAVLTWTNPADTDVQGVMIRRSTGSAPSTTTDGTLVYESSGTTTPIRDSATSRGTTTRLSRTTPDPTTPTVCPTMSFLRPALR